MNALETLGVIYPEICNNSTQYPYQEVYNQMPINMSAATIKNKTASESEEKYEFYSDEFNCCIFVEIFKFYKNSNLVMSGGMLAKTDYNNLKKAKNLQLTNFMINNVTLLEKETINGIANYYELECRYIDKSTYQPQKKKIVISSDELMSEKLINCISEAFKDILVPFPQSFKKIHYKYLYEYILSKYFISENKKCIDIEPDVIDLSELLEEDICTDIAKMYEDSLEIQFLLFSLFVSVCYEKIHDYYENLFPCGKTIVIYNNDICKKNYIMFLMNNSKLLKLSDIKLNNNELETILFDNQFHVSAFEDDAISDYSKKQNITKINRLVEYADNGIRSVNNKIIPCFSIVFTERKLINFDNIASGCIFINAENIKVYEDSSKSVQGFISMIYNYLEKFLNSKEINSKIMSGAEFTPYNLRNTYILFNLFQTISDIFFKRFEAYPEWHNMIRRTTKNNTFYFLTNNKNILSDSGIVEEFKSKLNRLLKSHQIRVGTYNQNVITTDEALLYEHDGHELLLFTQSYFENKFSSYVVDNKTLRSLLNDYNCILVNVADKCNFRMPIDERKSYIAVKTDILDDDTKKILPKLHSVFVPDINDNVERVYLSEDKHNNPVYWATSKQENRSVLIQGNTRSGKTYFTITRLIAGLHRLKYHIVIFDSAASSYSPYELKKCGLIEEMINMNFYYGTDSDNAEEIINEISEAGDMIYIVNGNISSKTKTKLCNLLFKTQNKFFNMYYENTNPLFIVLEEASDCNILDSEELKRLYNQGSKIKISMITILQMFSGKGSLKFRKMVNQSSLKICFKSSPDCTKYFIDSLPTEFRSNAKSAIPFLEVGESVIYGDFENEDDSLSTQCFIMKKKLMSRHRFLKIISKKYLYTQI